MPLWYIISSSYDDRTLSAGLSDSPAVEGEDLRPCGQPPEYNGIRLSDSSVAKGEDLRTWGQPPEYNGICLSDSPVAEGEDLRTWSNFHSTAARVRATGVTVLSPRSTFGFNPTIRSVATGN